MTLIFNRIAIIFLLLVSNISANAEETTAENTPKAATSQKQQDNSNDDKKSGAMSRADSIKPPSNLFHQAQNDAKHYLNKTEPLLVGTEEFTTIFNASNTANNKGVFILLPDWQQSIASPKNMANLQNSLPDLGWATLIIQPINKPENFPSTALKIEEQQEQNNKILTKHKKQLAQIISALMSKVENMPGTFIFVSEGNHASMIFDIFSDENISKPQGIILLSAYTELLSENETFAKTLAMNELPVLDLLLTKENVMVKESALLRRQHAAKELKVMYRQQEISNFHPSYYPAESLLIAIKGWLKYIGW